LNCSLFRFIRCFFPLRCCGQFSWALGTGGRGKIGN
jgi:hypothetical protein